MPCHTQVLLSSSSSLRTPMMKALLQKNLASVIKQQEAEAEEARKKAEEERLAAEAEEERLASLQHESVHEEEPAVDFAALDQMLMAPSPPQVHPMDAPSSSSGPRLRSAPANISEHPPAELLGAIMDNQCLIFSALKDLTSAFSKATELQDELLKFYQAQRRSQ